MVIFRCVTGPLNAQWLKSTMTYDSSWFCWLCSSSADFTWARPCSCVQRVGVLGAGLSRNCWDIWAPLLLLFHPRLLGGLRFQRTKVEATKLFEAYIVEFAQQHSHHITPVPVSHKGQPDITGAGEWILLLDGSSKITLQRAVHSGMGQTCDRWENCWDSTLYYLHSSDKCVVNDKTPMFQAWRKAIFKSIR